MADVNWKSKYLELKSKYMSAVDASYRLGIQEGIQQAQVQQVQDQAAQQQADEQAAAQGQPGQDGQGQPGQSGQDGTEQAPDSEHPQGSELDQHISQLEGMLGKTELNIDDLQAIKKSVEALKFGIEMKKSDMAVKGIARALAPKKFAISSTAQANLTPTAKAALEGQQRIVNDIMKAWDSQEPGLSKSIADIVAGEGLKKD